MSGAPGKQKASGAQLAWAGAKRCLLRVSLRLALGSVVQSQGTAPGSPLCSSGRLGGLSGLQPSGENPRKQQALYLGTLRPREGRGWLQPLMGRRGAGREPVVWARPGSQCLGTHGVPVLCRCLLQSGVGGSQEAWSGQEVTGRRDPRVQGLSLSPLGGPWEKDLGWASWGGGTGPTPTMAAGALSRHRHGPCGQRRAPFPQQGGCPPMPPTGACTQQRNPRGLGCYPCPIRPLCGFLQGPPHTLGEGWPGHHGGSEWELGA